MGSCTSNPKEHKTQKQPLIISKEWINDYILKHYNNVNIRNKKFWDAINDDKIMQHPSILSKLIDAALALKISREEDDCGINDIDSLIVPENETISLKSQEKHIFRNVIISKNGKLNIQSNECPSSLFLSISEYLILQENASITVSGSGYFGGIQDTQTEWSECTINMPSPYCLLERKSYLNTSNNDYALNNLYYGYGGKGGVYDIGGRGGGILSIIANKSIIMSNKSFITANGYNCKHFSGYGGYGGSIRIICNKLILYKTAIIQSCGGYKGKSGRIAIYIRDNINRNNLNKMICGTDCQINPKPFITESQKQYYYLLIFGYLSKIIKVSDLLDYIILLIREYYMFNENIHDELNQLWRRRSSSVPDSIP